MVFSKGFAKCLSLAIAVPFLFGSIGGVEALTRRVTSYRNIAINSKPISWRVPPSSNATCPDPYQHSDVFKSVAYFANW